MLKTKETKAVVRKHHLELTETLVAALLFLRLTSCNKNKQTNQPTKMTP